MPKRIVRHSGIKQSHPLLTREPNTVDQALDKTIELLYPVFMDWIKKKKGWVTVSGIYQIKTWYEF